MDSNLTQVLLLTEILTSPSDLAILSLSDLHSLPLRAFHTPYECLED
jgi:hypothetical protein